MTDLNLTVLVENTASGRGILGEHGLAYWIEIGPHRVLFDTGQTAATLRHNADRLGVDLTTVDAVVLSHGHYDHTGGLSEILPMLDHPRLVLHPGAISRRYSLQRDGAVNEAGMPAGIDHAFLERHADVVWSRRDAEVVPGLRVTGEVPRDNPYEDTGGDFFMDATCSETDPIVDDQAVFFDAEPGVAVVLGCGHSGVINTLQHVRRLTSERPIHAVIGGMHLLRASAERMKRTIEALRDLNVEYVVPAHCTGAKQIALLHCEMPDVWQPCHAGARFSFRLHSTKR